MKRTIALLLALVMVFALAACGQQSSAPAAPAELLSPTGTGTRRYCLAFIISEYNSDCKNFSQRK